MTREVVVYSNEKVAQLIVALLKEHGIKRVVASPGNTNFGIVGSVQNDSFFEVYSAVDERSAAFMACGLAEMTGERVVLSCTGATASRNYMPGLTEAFYRKLPVIAITSFNGAQNVGQLMPQNIDRSQAPKDVVAYSVDLPLIKDQKDEHFCNRVVNEALLAALRNGGQTVHINMTVDYQNGAFTTSSLPRQRKIERLSVHDKLPSLEKFNKIAVFVGSHRPFDEDEHSALESFVRSHNTVVLTDHTSNYRGAKSVVSAIAAENTSRWASDNAALQPDLVIDMGEVSGDYVTPAFLRQGSAEVWRLSPDGEIRERFNRLAKVIEGKPAEFFLRYASDTLASTAYYDAWENKARAMREQLPMLPFTNRWIASVTHGKIPANSVLHLAILNSLRSWNYFELDSSVDCFSNVGGFGIDGCTSTSLGAALADPSRMNYVITGDLNFFYDMNALGSRHLPKNLRIILINNGLGIEFKMPYSPASVMESEVEPFVAAKGHFVNQYPKVEGAGSTPAKAWCEALGIAYLHASNKQEYLDRIDGFLTGDSRAPIVFECFINEEDEVAASTVFAAIDEDNAKKRDLANKAKSLLPTGVSSAIKKIIR